ncbi:recombinase family protein [Paenibacillus sp. L3-i20]|uniref:recombinase family protein n=1 Tax=Paenibacillus sp. L3-i20 TaxID=2905833 RepID=UPI001EE010D8|nr:recombinase family protein [Paenibacillus sp. L3-i20]GKU79883.1 resolvase homolog YokA [Paenibacillus sp. L3-i20]
MAYMSSVDFLKANGVVSILNYNRKSRKEIDLERKTGEDTLKNMRDLMDRILAPLGIPYIQMDEIGSGDKIESRPVFQNVLKLLEQGLYQAIAVKEISRMGRGSYADMGVIYDLIVTNRIFIITPSRVFDPKNGSDTRQIRFELFFAREEFETTRERLTGGKITKAMEGRWTAGKVPFGYTRNKNTRKLEIDPENARIIRIIFDLFAYGIPIKGSDKRRNVGSRSISTYLLSQKIPTSTKRGERWSTGVIESILINDAYIGTVAYNRTEILPDGTKIERPLEEHVIVHNAHEPIIDLVTWNKAQAKLALDTDAPRVKLQATITELTSLCVCKVCGYKMTRNQRREKYKKKDGEISIHNKDFMVCRYSQCTSVKYNLVLDQLVETISYLRDLKDDEIETTLLSISSSSSDNRPKESVKDIEQYIERRNTELKTRLKFIRDKYEQGKYDDEEFEESRNEIRDEQAKLKQMLFNYNEQSLDNKPELDIAKVRGNFNSALQIFNNAVDPEDKNRILRSIFEKVYVEVIEKGRRNKPGKFILYPVLRYSFIYDDFFLVL